MSTIAENLLALQQVKTDIKTAIEGKGQDLTNVPFTEYAEKIENIGGGAEWQPDADMQWAKSVCENDTQAGFTYKVLQMVSDGYVYTDIVVPSGGAVKTSDGGYYTENAKHIWDDTNARQSAVASYKTRWLIYYYSSETPDITLLDEVIYACFDGVKFGLIFKGKKVLQYFDIINGANLKSVETTISYMFQDCYSLQTIPLLNTSNVTNMQNMFNNCYSLQTIPLLNTSNVTNMNSMFNNCYSLQTIPLLNTSNVTNMNSMLIRCYSLQTIPLLDTSNVTDMSYMFYNCYALQTIPLLNTNKVTDMSSMFGSCKILQTIPLLNTNKVTNMRTMFGNCAVLQSIPQLDTSNVTNMQNMFSSCNKLQSVNLNLNSIISASNQNGLFSSCAKLEFLTLTNIKWKLDISASTKYSHDTLLAIINNLVDLTGKTSQKLTMGSTNLAKLSDEEKAIATNKNWTLA